MGERLRRFGDALLDRRLPLGEPLRDLLPRGEGLLDLRPPLPLELERRLLRREAEWLLDLNMINNVIHIQIYLYLIRYI